MPYVLMMEWDNPKGTRYKEYAKLQKKFSEEGPPKLYQKLVDDIPDTRYALKLRLNLSEVFLARGEMVQARKNLDGLIAGDFGERTAIPVLPRRNPRRRITSQPSSRWQVVPAALD